MMPVVFVAHGSPMLALDRDKGADLSRWAAQLPRPRAIVAISAHWEDDRPLLGSDRQQDLIYDFGGFPPEMYRLQYRYPAANGLRDRVARLLRHAGWGTGRTDRGLDHGVWVPLLHMYPQADVPVLQVALPSRHTHRMLLSLGQALAPLRQDMLIMASGVLVHNFSFMGGGGPEPWAVAFEAWIIEKLQAWDLDALVNYQVMAPGAGQAVPTPEHFVPLFVALGAAGDDPALGVPIRGFELGSLSRTCLQFG
ncbi:MAG TPA: class III extradiol ring-cleavage dioxygenase [Candidatus Xenobia bacterium]|jgi:4,5-DOPA dioxygenase extradiol